MKLASGIVKAAALVVVSHFTGHLAAGFGCALKNMGMGCSSRRGKMVQHSTAKPKIKAKACTSCGLCVQWCPASAITMEEKSAVIDSAKCIGCGQCLAVCRFDAVAYNWGATYEDLQKKVVEHAWGVALGKKDKMICVNFLTRISKDCDCMKDFEQIVPDIGILVSRTRSPSTPRPSTWWRSGPGKNSPRLPTTFPTGSRSTMPARSGSGTPTMSWSPRPDGTEMPHPALIS